MVRAFALLAKIEGWSFLLILFLTMPLKRLAEIGWPNKIVGMAHGILFLAYVVLCIVVAQQLKWNFKKTLIALLCSVIPFGTFWMERQYLLELEHQGE